MNFRRNSWYYGISRSFFFCQFEWRKSYARCQREATVDYEFFTRMIPNHFAIRFEELPFDNAFVRAYPSKVPTFASLDRVKDFESVREHHTRLATPVCNASEPWIENVSWVAENASVIVFMNRVVELRDAPRDRKYSTSANILNIFYRAEIRFEIFLLGGKLHLFRYSSVYDIFFNLFLGERANDLSLKDTRKLANYSNLILTRDARAKVV